MSLFHKTNSHHHNHSHRSQSVETDTNTVDALDRYQQTKKVTLVGAAINLCLAVSKIVVGYTSQSQALIADGIHSLSDLITDALVLIAAKHSSRTADLNHPYGHGRIETMITVALGLFLIVVAAGIAVDALNRVLEPSLLMHPHTLALVVAGISVFANEFLYFYTRRVAEKIRSNLLKANAWHHRTDSMSSLIVIIGIAGTMIGVSYLDAIAAVGVALMIGKIGWDISIQNIRELVDTGLEPSQVGAIHNLIKSVDGVKHVHMLRTRRVGGDALVDVHIQVNPRLSVSEGHYISEIVQLALIEGIPDVTDVMVHIDSENDEVQNLSNALPNRNQLIKSLKNGWQTIKEAQYIDRITLHYLEGKIDVELFLPIEKLTSPDQTGAVSAALREAAKSLGPTVSVQVFFY